jgi:membrane fusion protein (multidrug efflux system)
MIRIALKLSSIAALGVLAACNPGGQGGAAKGGPGAMGAMPPAEVEVMVAARGSAAITQELPGRLAAFRTSQVRARVEGVVEKRLFSEGSDVREGTALFRIDPRSYQAAFDAAQADRSLAQLTVDRYKPLIEINAISKQEMDLAQAKLKQADAAFTRAKIDLENTTVPAPISGRIGRELVTEGALVGRNEATPLATIEQIDPIYANFTQSGADALRLRKAIGSGKLKAAQEPKIELVLEDGSIYPQPGKLLFTDLAVEPATGSVSLRAVFPNPRRELLPGTFVRVRFPEAIADDVILVPQRAVQVGPMGQFVTVVNGEGKAAVMPVKTGGMSGKDFVIAEGLQGGEQIIVNGLQKARPGSPVKPMVLGADGKPLPPPAAEPKQGAPAGPSSDASAPKTPAAPSTAPGAKK